MISVVWFCSFWFEVFWKGICFDSIMYWGVGRKVRSVRAAGLREVRSLIF